MVAVNIKNKSKDPGLEKGRQSAPSSQGPASKKRKTAHNAVQELPDKKREVSNGTKTEPILPQKISILRGDEPLFPRGGGSVLTPLEHRQIRVDADRDVLFEQSGKGSRPRTVEDNDDRGDGNHEPVQASTRRKRARAQAKPIPSGPPTEEVAARIEGLSFSRMVPGTLVLGQVSQITSDDVGLSLPNNLTGYVPITGVSKQVTEKVSRQADDDGDGAQGGREDAPVTAEIDLDKLFSVGRYLRACVTSVRTGSSVSGSVKRKRHIELSVDPRLANRGLSKTDLVPNVVVQASVVSVEDHGLVMDVALADVAVRGFMPSIEAGPGIAIGKVEPGTPFLCVVTGQSSNGRVVKLSANLQQAGKAKQARLLTDAPTVDAFLPGTAVEMSVVDVSPFGVAGKLMATVDATADIYHCGATGEQSGFQTQLQPNDKALARVICTFPKAEPKKVGVSLLDHIRSLSTLSDGQDEDAKYPLDTLPISTIVDKATVVKVASNIGLWLKLGDKAILGFAHISTISDERIESLHESSGPYQVGAKHRARVTGYNGIDGSYIVSLEKTVLSRPFLRLEDVKPGQVAEGSIEKIIKKDDAITALLVNLGQGITGLVPGIQFSDVKLSHPEKRFKEGAMVTTRVLSNDVERRLLRLTLKKSLVQSELPILASYEDVPSESRFLGILTNLMHSGAMVQLFGPVRAFLPRAEMSEAQVDDPRKDFQVGQVVNVRVVSVDSEKRKMVVSCKDVSSSDRELAHALEPPRHRREGQPGQKKRRKGVEDGLKTTGSKEGLEKTGSEEAPKKQGSADGLKTNGFDWTASVLDQEHHERVSDSDDAEAQQPTKKKKRRAEIKVDRTGDLDAHGPQSVADFERLLLGEPDSSYLWLQYMAFQLQLGEVDKAREIAERALATISISEDAEKLNVWIALLNLENTYGTDASLQDIFHQACQFNDAQEIHERLVSIYIQSEKLTQADGLFQSAVKKFSQSPSLWLNYATFLMTTLNSPDRARSLLPRATQALPQHHHLDITSKFAQLEFRSPNGNPERGRTFFEGLFTTWPKRLDLWNILLDLEIKQGETDRVRSLFERIVAKGLKPSKAKWFFKRWLEFEEKKLQKGDDADAAKRVENVKARAAQYVLERKGEGK